jgi:pyridoxal phosphate enzyme (YggS family)
MSIKENLDSARKTIAEAAKKSGRKPGEIVLIGVSKTFPVSKIVEAVNAGLSDIGENRLQEAETKFPLLANVRKHFVGHLQGNKVKKAVEISDMIQSVDSLKIAERISEASLGFNKITPVLIQVMTDEKKQFGVKPHEIENFIRCASELKDIRITGLMTIGPYFENPEQARPVFREMKRLFDSARSIKIPNVEMRYLSMGMSSDFAVAIEEGANMVRLGQAIFGERK